MRVNLFHFRLCNKIFIKKTLDIYFPLELNYQNVTMVLTLQIIKLQEVISLILEENFVKTDADYEAAAAIIQSFTSHIDAIETFRRLYQSQSNVEEHSVKKTNDDSSSSDPPDSNIPETENTEYDETPGFLDDEDRETEMIASVKKEEFKIEDEQHAAKRENNHQAIFRCVFCEADFESELQMSEHDSESHILDEKYKCISCELVSGEKKEIVQHFLVDHKNIPVYKCSKCTEIFLSWTEIIEHMKTDHLISLSNKACPICMKEISGRRQRIRNHMEREHTSVKFYCNVCDKKYTDSDTLKFHKRNYHENGGPQKFCCNICGVSVVGKIGYENHKEKHNITEQNVPCPKCGKLFYTKLDMKRHDYRAHPKREPQSHKCIHCDYKTPFKFRLTRHLSTTHSDKRFTCQECGISVKTADILKTHILIHTGERRHECSFCGKKFKTSTNLRSHTKIHTGEYDAHCDICGINFVQKCNYKLHMNNKHA